MDREKAPVEDLILRLRVNEEIDPVELIDGLPDDLRELVVDWECLGTKPVRSS